MSAFIEKKKEKACSQVVNCGQKISYWTLLPTFTLPWRASHPLMLLFCKTFIVALLESNSAKQCRRAQIQQ